jgi:tetrathionate reductase subunit C
MSIPHEFISEYLNVGHSPGLTPLLANYSALFGIAGAIFLFWAWRQLRGVGTDRPVHRFSLPMVAALGIAGLFNPLVEMEQPGHFWNIYFYGLARSGWGDMGTAIIKMGVIFLPLFVVLAWWLGMSVLRPQIVAALDGRPRWQRVIGDIFTLWVRRFSPLSRPAFGRGITVFGVIVALFAILYSPIFLMTEHGVELWSSAFVPAVFFASAIAGGAAFLWLMLPVASYLAATREPARADTQHVRWLWLGSLAAAILWLLWHQYAWHYGTVELRRAFWTLENPYWWLSWGWWFWGGAAVSAVLLIFRRLRENPWVVTVCAASALMGTFALRFAVLIAGQAVPRSGAGYYWYVMPGGMLANLIFDWVLCAGLLAFVWVALPYSSVKPEEEKAPITHMNEEVSSNG